MQAIKRISKDKNVISLCNRKRYEMIEELFKDTTMTKSQEDSINYIKSNKDYIVNSHKVDKTSYMHLYLVAAIKFV